MEYLLVLDSYKHSVIDSLFYEIHPTIESCKNRIQQLLADNKITMLYNGDAKHKIYVISISRKISEDEYLRIERSYDGKNWENMKDEHPATTYSKTEVARGKSIKLHIEGEIKKSILPTLL